MLFFKVFDYHSHVHADSVSHAAHKAFATPFKELRIECIAASLQCGFVKASIRILNEAAQSFTPSFVSRVQSCEKRKHFVVTKTYVFVRVQISPCRLDQLH